MSKTVVLDHVFDLGPQNPASYVAKVQAIDVYELPPPGQGILDILGMTIVSDVTAVFGGALKRTITLQTTAVGDQLYPTADAVKNATRNIFRDALGQRTPALVLALEPVVT